MKSNKLGLGEGGNMLVLQKEDSCETTCSGKGTDVFFSEFPI